MWNKVMKFGFVVGLLCFEILASRLITRLLIGCSEVVIVPATEPTAYQLTLFGFNIGKPVNHIEEIDIDIYSKAVNIMISHLLGSYAVHP